MGLFKILQNDIRRVGSENAKFGIIFMCVKNATLARRWHRNRELKEQCKLQIERAGDRNVGYEEL